MNPRLHRLADRARRRHLTRRRSRPARARVGLGRPLSLVWPPPPPWVPSGPARVWGAVRQVVARAWPTRLDWRTRWVRVPVRAVWTLTGLAVLTMAVALALVVAVVQVLAELVAVALVVRGWTPPLTTAHLPHPTDPAPTEPAPAADQVLVEPATHHLHPSLTPVAAPAPVMVPAPVYYPHPTPPRMRTQRSPQARVFIALCWVSLVSGVGLWAVAWIAAIASTLGAIDPPPTSPRPAPAGIEGQGPS